MARAVAACRLLAGVPPRSQLLPARSVRSASRRGLQSHTKPPCLPFAFAFEYALTTSSFCLNYSDALSSIDGVLMRSSQPIPRAKEALGLLYERQVPFILLTNGGGKHEEERVADLSERLRVPLDPHMFVQSHTPFAAMVRGDEESPGLRDECILVVGGEGDRCRRVAER